MYLAWLWTPERSSLACPDLGSYSKFPSRRMQIGLQESCACNLLLTRFRNYSTGRRLGWGEWGTDENKPQWARQKVQCDISSDRKKWKTSVMSKVPKIFALFWIFKIRIKMQFILITKCACVCVYYVLGSRQVLYSPYPSYSPTWEEEWFLMRKG